MKKAARYCSRCRAVHQGDCPKKTAHNWNNKVRSNRGGRGGRPWQRKRQRIFERDNYLCQIHLARGQIVTVELHGERHGVLDHIVPKFEGGSDDDDNLQTICQACDKEKTHNESMRSRKK